MGEERFLNEVTTRCVQIEIRAQNNVCKDCGYDTSPSYNRYYRVSQKRSPTSKIVAELKLDQIN